MWERSSPFTSSRSSTPTPVRISNKSLEQRILNKYPFLIYLENDIFFKILLGILIILSLVHLSYLMPTEHQPKYLLKSKKCRQCNSNSFYNGFECTEYNSDFSSSEISRAFDEYISTGNSSFINFISKFPDAIPTDIQYQIFTEKGFYVNDNVFISCYQEGSTLYLKISILFIYIIVISFFIFSFLLRKNMKTKVKAA